LFQSLTGDGFLAACRRQDWPNQDVIRFLAVSLTGEPIPTGELGSLFFQASEEAVSGLSPLELLECTSLAAGSDQEEIPITAGDFRPGEIIVFGLEPPAKPAPPEAVLNLDGETLGSDNPMYRSQVEIADPIPVLAAGHDELTLSLPGGRPIMVATRQFIARDGFVDRLDCRDTQVPDNQPETPLSFRWYGEVDENGWLGVTVVDDIVRGTLVTSEQSFQLAGSPEEGYRLFEIDPEEMPPVHGNWMDDQFGRGAFTVQNDLKISASEPLLSTAEVTQSTAPVSLDLLIMYTAQAEIDAGGPASLDALIQQSIDNTNQALINSEYADLSVREAHRELLTGFVPGTTEQGGFDALYDLRVNSQIIAAQDERHADLTLVLLPNGLAFCGLAFLQSPTCGGLTDFPQCGSGMDFVDFAITWVSVSCANFPGRNSFPHEIGHLLGGDHQPAQGVAVADASFPWSYGHLRTTGTRFGTIMWVPGGGPELPQPLNFSNPSVLTLGNQPSGIINQRDNIRTFKALAPTVEQYRVPPPELIFADSFESP